MASQDRKERPSMYCKLLPTLPITGTVSHWDILSLPGKFLRFNVVFSSDYTTAFINILWEENIFVWKLRRETCPVSSQSKSARQSDAVLCTIVVLVLFYPIDSISSTGAEGMHFLLRRKERMNCEIKLSFVIIFVWFIPQITNSVLNIFFIKQRGTLQYSNNLLTIVIVIVIH